MSSMVSDEYLEEDELGKEAAAATDAELEEDSAKAPQASLACLSRTEATRTVTFLSEPVEERAAVLQR